MGRKQIINYFVLAQDADMSSDILTIYTTVEMTDNVKYYVIWDAPAPPLGTIEVQISDNENDWYTINATTGLDFLTNSGSHLIHLTLIDFKYVRVKYNTAGNAGTMTISIKGKSIGS